MSLRTEIHEQPAVRSRLLEKQAQTVRAIARSLEGREVHGVCYHLTRAKGFDTEAPRRLRKVTLTH